MKVCICEMLCTLPTVSFELFYYNRVRDGCYRQFVHSFWKVRVPSLVVKTLVRVCVYSTCLYIHEHVLSNLREESLCFSVGKQSIKAIMLTGMYYFCSTDV